MIDSEQSYCLNLEMLVKKVVVPAKEVIEDQEIHEILFCNLEQIFDLHFGFLTKLKEVMKNYNHLTTKLSTVILNELFNKNDFG